MLCLNGPHLSLVKVANDSNGTRPMDGGSCDDGVGNGELKLGGACSDRLLVIVNDGHLGPEPVAWNILGSRHPFVPGRSCRKIVLGPPRAVAPGDESFVAADDLLPGNVRCAVVDKAYRLGTSR